MPSPNPPKGVTVQYQPGNAKPWHQLPSSKIKVSSGSTTINWTLQLIPPNAGTIQFSTDPALPGVQFTGTGNNAWPGSAPSGSGSSYSSTIDNQLQPGQQKTPYPYIVNAVYTPTGGQPVHVAYDPEVESDPPTVAFE